MMSAPYVKVRSLAVSYLRRAGMRKERFLAVQKVSFEIPAGHCFALVGESGSGKSTVARALLGLTDIDSGTVQIGKFSLPPLARNENREFRRTVQVVFQDPYLALNPRLNVGRLIEEPLVIHGFDAATRRARIADVLHRVRLDPALLKRRASRLSGGQRQRVCIARALVLEPRLLIADEPVSALDLSVQASIIDLLLELKEQDGLTQLFVSHDMELVQFIADDVGVMYAGRLIEVGPPASLFCNPSHPYTRQLLSAVPSRLSAAGLTEDLPAARKAPAKRGCPWVPNCKDADLQCTLDMPPLVMVDPDHRCACFKVNRR